MPMKRLLLASAAITGLAFANSALAADLPLVSKAVPPVIPSCYDWTGVYVGGHIGGGWGSKSWTDLGGDDTSDNVSYKTSGFIGGGQGGFNYQFAPCSPWV